MDIEMDPDGTGPPQAVAEAQEQRRKKDTPTELRFTVERKEMLAGLGITPKILRTWEEAEIFVPELGPRTRHFTPKDVARLRFLKHLHSDLGLSKEVMQRLLSHFYYPRASGVEEFRENQQRKKQGQEPFPSNPARAYRLLDLKDIRLLSADEAFQTLVADTLSGWNERAIRQGVIGEWLIKLAQSVFRELWLAHFSNPGVYEAVRRDLWDQLKVVELAVRADVRDGELVSFSPPCSDDPEELSGPLVDEIIKRYNEIFPPDDYSEVPF